MNTKTLLIASALSVASFSANAIIVDLDNEALPNFEQATGTNTGNPDVWGMQLDFTDFSITGGVGKNASLPNAGLALVSGFDLSQILMTNIDQDSDGANGGIGVCAESSNCSGSSDSFSSNVGSGNKQDEVLIFDFSLDTYLETIWFNGDHKSLVNNGPKNEDNAMFNVFYSDDGNDFTSIFNNHQIPTDFDYFDLNEDAHQFWAVAATGYGDHSSYIQALEYSKVPEPSILALMGLGIFGLGLSRRKMKK